MKYLKLAGRPQRCWLTDLSALITAWGRRRRRDDTGENDGEANRIKGGREEDGWWMDRQWLHEPVQSCCSCSDSHRSCSFRKMTYSLYRRFKQAASSLWWLQWEAGNWERLQAAHPAPSVLLHPEIQVHKPHEKTSVHIHHERRATREQPDNHRLLNVDRAT